MPRRARSSDVLVPDVLAARLRKRGSELVRDLQKHPLGDVARARAVGATREEERVDQLELERFPLPEPEDQVPLVADQAALARRVGDLRVAQEGGRDGLSVEVVHELDRARPEDAATERAGEDVEVGEIGPDELAVNPEYIDAQEALESPEPNA